MKRRLLTILISSAFTLPAFAFDGKIHRGLQGYTPPPADTDDSRMRDAMRDELKASGGVVPGEIGRADAVPETSRKTRAEVRAEAVRAEQSEPQPEVWTPEG